MVCKADGFQVSGEEEVREAVIPRVTHEGGTCESNEVLKPLARAMST